MSTSLPSNTININDQIYCFQICENDFAQNLICIGCEEKIILGLIKFPEESDSNRFEWEYLKEIYHDNRCDALSFSPETSLASSPKVVMFCAGGGDFHLRIFRSDLINSDTVQSLRGHSSYINDIAWDYEGEYLASVSDDHSCRIWNCNENFEHSITFCLSSSGMSVKWHPEEPGKALVAEKNGIIHMYNVKTQQAIMSLESPKFPLMCADWSLHNRLFVTALAAGDILTWDLRRPCRPTNIKQFHEDGGRVVKFSPFSELITASIGRPDITLKVCTSKSQIPLIETSLKLYGGLSWHHRFSYVAAAFDRKLCFWKV